MIWHHRRLSPPTRPNSSLDRRGPATIAEWVMRHGLLWRCVAAFNAVMDEEPKRKRRWFQFSLRTLLISVTQE